MACEEEAQSFKEVRPPVLDRTADPPALFDGTTRLYMSYFCPYAQRVWIARNYKGLQEKIKLVPLDYAKKPQWYKEKVYPDNKVPCLEHNNEVRGESMDLVKYIDSQFEGPALLPDDPEKRKFGEEMVSYANSFNKVNFAALTCPGDVTNAQVGASFDKLEDALSKYKDGPFFLGTFFSLVDIAFASFVERFQIFFSAVKNYDVTDGRTNLSLWIKEMNKLAAYADTRLAPQELLDYLKQKYGWVN